MANRLIAHNKNRHDKVLRPFRNEGETPRILQYPDETTEANQVVEEIRSLIFRRLAEPRDIAILFRTNEQPRAFEAELRRSKLPYVLIGGMSFYDRKEVRDILAYLKALAQPRDEVSVLRIINTPPRGIGPARSNSSWSTPSPPASLLANFFIIHRQSRACNPPPWPAVSSCTSC